MFCPNCGEQISDDSLFCRSCGTKVEPPRASYDTRYKADPYPITDRSGMFACVKHVLKNYVNFQGRARRREYWLFVLAYLIVFYALAAVIEFAIIMPAIESGRDLNSYLTGGYMFLFIIILYVYVFAMLLPALAVSVRRLHDTGRSGFYMFFGFVPYIGAIILLVFTCLDGTAGPNKYGPDTKDRL